MRIELRIYLCLPFVHACCIITNSIMSALETSIEPTTSRKGLVAVAHTYAQAVELLERVNAALAEVAGEIKARNPAVLRLQHLRGSKTKMVGSAAGKALLGKPVATSALRLRLNNCGGDSCAGCPHPHWGVWRAYRDHATGATRNFMSEVRGTAQLWAYAKRAPDASTMALVGRALALIERRNSLVSAFASLGKIARAQTTELRSLPGAAGVTQAFFRAEARR